MAYFINLHIILLHKTVIFLLIYLLHRPQICTSISFYIIPLNLFLTSSIKKSCICRAVRSSCKYFFSCWKIAMTFVWQLLFVNKQFIFGRKLFYRLLYIFIIFDCYYNAETHIGQNSYIIDKSVLKTIILLHFK